MKFMKTGWLALALSLALHGGTWANAAEVGGVKMADQVKVAGKTLVLNGTGVRKKAIFKVYAAALYLEKKSGSAAEILKSEGLKSLEMVFLRGVDKGKITDAWTEGFDKNCEGDCAPLRDKLGKLKAAMIDMNEGDVMALNFLPDRVELLVKGKLASTIEGAAFSTNLLRVWLGKEPPSEGLKEGLLGKEG